MPEEQDNGENVKIWYTKSMVEFSDKQHNLLKDIANKYSLELLLLFGSRVTGRIHKESDYDIGYISSQKLTLDTEGQLIIDLLPVFGVIDERLINLVNIRKAPPLLLYAMTGQCQVLFERKPPAFAVLRALAFKKYIETQPLYHEKERRLKERISHPLS